ncbi:MAG: tRNA uridine-5-carboxymethylaminomethyl(34) synthesis GTPase MnmE [Oscillospiraceae bacterium]|jgi:tRNA modification GTPase|nr:tRNA uridine-5-carboxymethylaminomethyl(34) synthesis GTPase MnmE [Oscillospiraceae bacterium]
MADIIAAIATGKSPCAIGIIRLSGSGCAALAAQVFTPQNGVALTHAPNRKLTMGTVRDRKGRVIDHALAVCARAPHSYTGEDTVELQCHGSPAVLASAMEALLAAGARQASPGEFTKRAFLNGKLDLTQAEAVIDLIEAHSAEAAANAAGQLAGALQRQISPIYDALCDLCSHFHAVLDYPDEEIEDFTAGQMQSVFAANRAALTRLLQSYERGKYLQNGVKAVLLGRPNAGKSSLLNALAGFERVIVTDIAGTTRDTVEQTVRLGSVRVCLTDTAGIREAGDEIEAMGVQRAMEAAKRAQLALFVCDGSKALTQEDFSAMEAAKLAPRSIALINKSDLPQAVSPRELPFETVLCVSAKNGDKLEQLTTQIEQWYGQDGDYDGSLVTNARQFGALTRAHDAISRAQAALQGALTPDAVLTDVEAAMQALGELSGRTVREDITARIFERFCVGK